MSRAVTYLSILALACGGQFVYAAAMPRLVVDADANLHYQLDCLSGVIRCSTTNMTIELQNNEQPLLNRWRQLRQHAGTNPTLTSTSLLPTARSLAHVSSRHGLLAPHPVHPTLAKLDQQAILEHFRQRHDEQWVANDATHLLRLKSSLGALSQEPSIRSFWRDARTLYRGDQSTPPPVALIATRTPSLGSIATIDGDSIYAESPRNEAASNRLPVIAHEMVHFWQSTASNAHEQELVAAFLASESDCALFAYHMFDEVIASAVGNGLLEKHLQSERDFDRYEALPQSFYADPIIDRLAKRAMPMLSAYTQQQRALDAAFVADYVALSEQTMTEECRSLAANMRAMTFIAGSAALLGLADELRERWQVATMIRHHAAEQSPFKGLSTVVVATWEQLDELPLKPGESAQAALRRARQREESVVVVDQGHRHAKTYWVIGTNDVTSAAALQRLMSLTALPPLGVLEVNSSSIPH